MGFKITGMDSIVTKSIGVAVAISTVSILSTSAMREYNSKHIKGGKSIYSDKDIIKRSNVGLTHFKKTQPVTTINSKIPTHSINVNKNTDIKEHSEDQYTKRTHKVVEDDTHSYIHHPLPIIHCSTKIEYEKNLDNTATKYHYIIKRKNSKIQNDSDRDTIRIGSANTDSPSEESTGTTKYKNVNNTVIPSNKNQLTLGPKMDSENNTIKVGSYNIDNTKDKTITIGSYNN